MILLAIDTAGPRLQLALLRDDSVDTLVEDMPKGQAERIFPAIDELLARNAITYADLTRIAVTTGPGSFTGLRIGLSAARGLGLALGYPGDRRADARLRFRSAGPDDRVHRLPRCAARRGLRPVILRRRACPTSEARAAAHGEAPDPPSRPSPTRRSPIVALARFAATADPAAFPPDPTYIRDADAKPQEKFRVARQ